MSVQRFHCTISEEVCMYNIISIFYIRKGCYFYAKKLHRKGEKTMAVIIKLNGVTIGATTMTKDEIRNAENAGFTILRKGE